MAGVSSKPAGNPPAKPGDAMDADVADYRGLLIEIAGPVRLGENVKSVLARVAREAGLTQRRVRAIWHGEVRDVRGKELVKLLRAAREKNELEEARDAYRSLRQRLAACEAALGLQPEKQDRSVAD
jgi:predicted transcriptional regulator